MDNEAKINKLKLALRGIDIHIKKLNSKNSTMIIEGFLSNIKYPIKKAKEDVYNSKKDKYLITTINWSYTNKKSDEDFNANLPSPNLDEVYKRQYILSIEELFNFIKKLKKMSVKEEIIKIETYYETKI